MRGYSLLELLVVLAVLALVAIAAGATFSGMPRQSSPQNAISALALHIQSAQTKARLESRPIRMEMAGDGKALLIDGVAQPLAEFSVELPRPVLMDAEGFSSGGSLQLVGSDGLIVVLDVEPLTGALRVRSQQ